VWPNCVASDAPVDAVVIGGHRTEVQGVVCHVVRRHVRAVGGCVGRRVGRRVGAHVGRRVGAHVGRRVGGRIGAPELDAVLRPIHGDVGSRHVAAQCEVVGLNGG